MGPVEVEGGGPPLPPADVEKRRPIAVLDSITQRRMKQGESRVGASGVVGQAAPSDEPSQPYIRRPPRHPAEVDTEAGVGTPFA
jgi:hypothetical protein